MKPLAYIYLPVIALCAAMIPDQAALAATPAKHKNISQYEGSKTCLACHPNAATEIMKTIHWTWETKDSFSGQTLGKRNVINNYCIAVPSNEPRCTSCHIGLGYSDKNFDFSNKDNVDCLICHDTTGTYKKFPTGSGNPVSGSPKEFPVGSGIMWNPPDLNMIAQNAGKTSRANCGECHFYGGGGDRVKHGDIDSSLYNPTRNVDVHMGTDGLNFTCTKCHSTTDHQIPGSRYSKSEPDHAMCEKCHTAAPHSSSRLNAHTAHVACQTCHVPEVARGGLTTKMTWDWSSAGKKDAAGKLLVVKDENGDTQYDGQKGDFTWEQNGVPDYAWFNGNVVYTTLDDVIEPGQRVTINKLQGNIEDPKARIFPVKRFTGRQPYDATTKNLAVAHLFGSDSNAYWKTYNWTNALTAGMTYVGRQFSGNVGYVETEMLWIQNHMVAPKEQALTCANCHRPNGRLNFAKLGYDPERVADLTSLFVEPIFKIITSQIQSGVPSMQITFEAEKGGQYKVQRSDNLKQWKDVDGRLLTPEQGATTVNYTSGATSTNRFYRVIRIR